MKISYKLQVTSVAAEFTSVPCKLRITNAELRIIVGVTPFQLIINNEQLTIIVGVTFTVSRFYGISTIYFHRWLVAEIYGD